MDEAILVEVALGGEKFVDKNGGSEIFLSLKGISEYTEDAMCVVFCEVGTCRYSVVSSYSSLEGEPESVSLASVALNGLCSASVVSFALFWKFVSALCSVVIITLEPRRSEEATEVRIELLLLSK